MRSLGALVFNRDTMKREKATQFMKQSDGSEARMCAHTHPREVPQHDSAFLPELIRAGKSVAGAKQLTMLNRLFVLFEVFY